MCCRQVYAEPATGDPRIVPGLVDEEDYAAKMGEALEIVDRRRRLFYFSLFFFVLMQVSLAGGRETRTGQGHGPGPEYFDTYTCKGGVLCSDPDVGPQFSFDMEDVWECCAAYCCVGDEDVTAPGPTCRELDYEDESFVEDSCIWTKGERIVTQGQHSHHRE